MTVTLFQNHPLVATSRYSLNGRVLGLIKIRQRTSFLQSKSDLPAAQRHRLLRGDSTGVLGIWALPVGPWAVGPWVRAPSFCDTFFTFDVNRWARTCSKVLLRTSVPSQVRDEW